ncbi:MAG: hypothetical protein ACE3JK_07260 [Sporolactobacillus sp.]
MVITYLSETGGDRGEVYGLVSAHCRPLVLQQIALFNCLMALPF